MDGSDVFEFVSIAVESPNTNNSLCICTLYCPTASHTSFFYKLYTSLRMLGPHNFSSFVLLGDFNVNLPDLMR